MDEFEALLKEERDLQLPYFDADVAWKIGCYIREKASAESLALTFGVSRLGQQLFHCAMNGAPPDYSDWVQRKSAVVYRFHHSSHYMRKLCDHQGRTLHERYAVSPQDYAAVGGAFPIFLRGVGCIGAVSVSGLTPVEDHNLAAEAIRAIVRAAA